MKQFYVAYPRLSSFPQNFFTHNGYFYFVADNTSSNYLFRSDGTPAGTKVIPGMSYPIDFTFCKGLLLYTAWDSAANMQLWVSDSSLTHSKIVKKINPNGMSMYASTHLANIDDKIYFSANDGVHGYEPWVSDGTDTGTYMIKNINVTTGSDPAGFIKYNNKIYFVANDFVSGRELWVTDGSDTGTHLFKDIMPGIDDSSPNIWQVFKNKLYFRVNGVSKFPGSNELWQTDGTDTGTHVALTICNFPSYPIGCSELNNRLLFTASLCNVGYRLYSWDGTDTGLVNLAPYSAVWGTSLFYKGKFLIGMKDSNGVNGLWMTDGTISGTSWLTNRFSNGGAAPPLGIYDGRLYLRGNDGKNGLELWATDGTDSGTVKIPWNGPPIANPLSDTHEAIVYDSMFFFPGFYDVNGVQLYTLGPQDLQVKQHIASHTKFSVYPNPTTGKFTVIPEDYISVSVANAWGSKILETEKSKIDIHQFPAGIYFLSIVDRKGAMQVLRILKTD